MRFLAVQGACRDIAMTEDPTIQFGTESVAQAAPPPLESVWGGFQLLSRVGAGGFGEVYRAWDPNLQREIALKLLLPGALDTESEYQATLREARALASVKHPNIVSIYGCDRHDGRVGFWTDFIHGKTLASLLLAQGPFGYHEAALIGLEVTRALSAVHRANLLHRDIKPENVMREEGGRILLMDFGLSALPQHGSLHTSQLAGTPNYMAPELFRRQPASVATDLYAVGVLLYFLVSGQTPARLNGLTTAQAAEACTQRTPLIDLRSDLPETFLRIVNRAIAINPDERFRSAGEMAEALAASLGASSISDAEPIPVPIPAPPPPPPVPARVLTAKEQRREKKEREKRASSPWFKYGIAAVVLLSIFGRKLPLISMLYGPESSKPAHVKVPEADAADDSDSDSDAKADRSASSNDAQALVLKSLENAKAEIEKSLGAEPKASSYEELSRIDLETGSFADAVAASRQAVALDPASDAAWRSLGDACRMIPADREQSLAAYTNAIAFAEATRKKEPKNAQLAAALAIDYARAGDKAHAAAMIRQATRLSADDPRVNYLAGQAAEIVGNRPQAVALIAKAIGAGYSLAEIERNPDLAALRADPQFQQHLPGTKPGMP
jgi:serine/threonine-protein kinase